MKITIPVTVGRRETLIKSKDIELELLDDVFKIKKLYIKECPKDYDDEYSAFKETRFECEATVRKSDISIIIWAYSVGGEVYQTDICTLKEDYGFYMRDREHAIEVYNQLLDWWLK